VELKCLKILLASLYVFTLHFPSSPGTTLTRYKIHIIGMIENMHNNCADWLPNWSAPQSGTDASDEAAPGGRADPVMQPADMRSPREPRPEAILSGGSLVIPVPFMRVMTMRPGQRTRPRIRIGQKRGPLGHLPPGSADPCVYRPTSHFVTSKPAPGRGWLNQPRSFE
jgi:hypothetical protein